MRPRDQLYRLAYLATATHDIAESLTDEVLREHPTADTDTLVAKLIAHFAEEIVKYPRTDWREWDLQLRTSLTTPDGLSTFERNRQAWELKRLCLAQALCSIRPTARLAFIYVDVYGVALEQASKALHIGEKALRVRLTRARKYVADLLESSCQHLGRQNPCTCMGRVGIALRKGMLPKQPVLPTPASSHVTRPTDDVSRLYRHLPIVAP